ncbi:MAG: ABC transporter permease [Marmoricola sp.]
MAMRRLILGRLLSLVPTVLLASFGIFLLVHLAPGDPAVALAGENATVQQVQAIRHAQGFDRPLLVQYGTWLDHAIHGNLGVSITNHIGVASEIGTALPATLELVAGGLLVAIILGLLGGVITARRAHTRVDAALSSVAAAGAAIPSFWLGLVLVSVFALRLGWLPATGYTGITVDPAMAFRQLLLPSLALGLAGAAEITRQLRSSMIDVLASDHVRTLRAKGLGDRDIVWRHALKGSAIPLMTVIGLQVSRLLGATVVVEAVFGISGIGSLVVNAAQNKDYPIVEGVVLIMAAIVIATNVVVDVSYRLFDPRIR